MPKFKCNYSECENFGKEVTLAKVSFMFNEKTKQMELRGNYPCPICHNKMEYVPPKEGAVHGFNFNRFDSLTSEQKRDVIKKRSQEHFRRTDKGDLKNYKEKIIRDNKRMVEGR